MQYQMSSAPGVAPQPAPPGLAPVVTPTGAPQKPRRNPWPVIVVGIIAVAGLAWFLWSRQAAGKAENAANAAAVIRTGAARKGDLVHTLRLTGTTSAEKFASLLVPQLRGSRGDGLREGKTFQSPGANYTVNSNSQGGGSSSPAGGSLSSSAGGSGGGDTQIASTNGQSTGGSAALRSATSRVGNRSSANTGGNTSRTTTSADSSGGLGSTASQLVGSGQGGGGTGGGGGGGMRGGGDFGLVLQTVAKPGAHVKKSEVIAEFDRQNMMNRLEDYRAAVAQTDSSFVKLKAEIEVQRRTHAQSVENAKAALDQARLDEKTIPVLGQIDAERIRLAAEEADAKYKQLLAEVKFVEAGYNAQVKQSQLEVEQSHLELKRAEMNADRMLMKAPLDGLIVMQTIFRGSEMGQIQQGDQLYPGMRFMQVVDPSSMVVNATVNQVDSDAVRVGYKAKVRFDAFPELELPATVIAIGAMTRPGMMRAAYVKEIPVVLKLDKLDPRVIPDLSVSVDVEVASEKQAVIAPAGAVFQEGGSTPTSWVFVRQGGGWEKRQIVTGLASNLDVAVRSGLQPGEVVALERPPEEAKGQS